ncbi:MAG: carbohydrate binding family 9 domain-containing protein, partial [Acidobacteria bacterium]|nr:carbohydrate binding family 9 domain-containing protein [Acidobacteriota bacterium]
MRHTCLLAMTVSLASSPPASPPAANSGARVAVTVPAATAVQFDGDLNEEVWRRAPVITGFKQRDPRDGAPATFETEARVAYDDHAMYVAVQANDPDPAQLIGLRTRRDEHSPSDWIRVVVDSFHDRRTAYEFAVNPVGVKQDGYWFNDGNNDQGWDAVWDVAVSRTDRGWRAEFRIPLSQLRFKPSENATFGFAVVRHIGRLNETSTWPLLSKNVNGYVSSFGDLTGLNLTDSAKRLELVPYLVGDLKGSTLFVVWQQGREGTLDRGTFNLGRDVGGAFDAPARNVFLVK